MNLLQYVLVHCPKPALLLVTNFLSNYWYEYLNTKHTIFVHVEYKILNFLNQSANTVGIFALGVLSLHVPEVADRYLAKAFFWKFKIDIELSLIKVEHVKMWMYQVKMNNVAWITHSFCSFFSFTHFFQMVVNTTYCNLSKMHVRVTPIPQNCPLV